MQMAWLPQAELELGMEIISLQGTSSVNQLSNTMTPQIRGLICPLNDLRRELKDEQRTGKE
jgi:capsule polysaccharide export protein KpsE/RkpR